MLYELARPLLFRMDPETAHGLVLPSFKLLHRLGLPGLPGGAIAGARVRAMGLDFPNPVGSATSTSRPPSSASIAASCSRWRRLI